MCKIKISNFGAIKGGFQGDDGWLNVNKVTVFVGNQGSGKSTIAKLVSIFTWIEKGLVRGDRDIKWFEKKNQLKNQFLPYHRLKDYLNADTVIEYIGNAYSIRYTDGFMDITKTANGAYHLPQIMYVPAERNFLTYIKSAKTLKLSSEALQDFNTEYNNSKDSLKGIIRLPVNDMDIEYIKQHDSLYLKGEDYKIGIIDASSGFQSFVPLYLVSSYLANSVKKHSDNKDTMSAEERARFKDNVQNIWNDDSLTDEQKRLAISALSAKFNKTAFVNIVEEPEQNLFPSSQWQMLQSLLTFNNMSVGNKLVITTHSPYLINYLTLLVKAEELSRKIKTDNQKDDLKKIVSQNAMIEANNLSIYEFDEKNGCIQSLETFEGLPSDENRLNMMLDEGNELFAKLLEIQQQLQKE